MDNIKTADKQKKQRKKDDRKTFWKNVKFGEGDTYFFSREFTICFIVLVTRRQFRGTCYFNDIQLRYDAKQRCFSGQCLRSDIVSTTHPFAIETKSFSKSEGPNRSRRGRN